ncbi:MAG: hypothetical protein WC121_12760 [Candidatus Kapaibacterium sp.]|jgi:hypothetical protein
MKKLLYILPIFILILSCNEDPSKVQKDERFKTVYGLERTLENSQRAGVIGNTSKNACTRIDTISFSTFPNPTAFGTTIDFFTDSKRTVEIFIETAIGDDEFLDSLSTSGFTVTPRLIQHETYFKKSLYSGEVNVGTYSINVDLKEIVTGVYYLIYEDSEGNSDCYPLVVQRYEG